MTRAGIDWSHLYARLMTACGYTPAQIDDIAMTDALTLLRYWRDKPPVHEILAAVHAIAPAPGVNPGDPSGIGELIARYPGGRAGLGQRS